jgi:sulfotransferase family protein
MERGARLVDSENRASFADGLRALAAPGERRCGLPTREAIDVLTAGLAGADLTPLGWVVAANEITHGVEVQRQVEIELDATPARHELTRPVVIGGLPRGGTALLHHLLALSPSFRAAREWEVTSPTATARARRSDGPRVIRDAVRMGRVRMEFLEVVAPRLPELAPISVHSGEGCTQLLHHSLCSLHLLTMFRADGYAEWLLAQDLEPVYRFWAAQLQLIDPAAERWLGASPLHMFGYAPLWSAVPSASVIHVQRDPIAAFEVFVDAAIAVRRVFADQLDARSTALEWLDLWAIMLRRAAEGVDCAVARGHAFVPVEHDDLQDDPVGVVIDVCARLGVEAPPVRTVGALASALREREREQHDGFERFGLTRETVEEALAPAQAALDRSTRRLR